MTHAWCTDPGRDAAVRAAEDGRQGALPTLEEAIGEVFPRQEATASGLRTERVTLEITHKSPTSAAEFLPRRLWWDRKGESVRVVADEEREAELVEKRRWVPVGERLPEPFSDVLVFSCVATVNVIKGAYYDDGSQAGLGNDFTADYLRGWWHERNSVGTVKLDGCMTPTHWQPLPTGPEGDASSGC